MTLANIFYLILVLAVGKNIIFCVMCSRNFVFSVAAETRYPNASNRKLGDHFQTKHDGENGVDASIEKRTPKLLQFTFQELKSATLNFRPDSILGEGGFGYVFKGWIEPNSTAPAKPGTGVTVAVKSLKPDALQGHREWVVSIVWLFFLFEWSIVDMVFKNNHIFRQKLTFWDSCIINTLLS